MRRAVAGLVTLQLLCLAASTPAGAGRAGAQQVDAMRLDGAWPRSWAPPTGVRTVGATHDLLAAASQEARLMALDDQGLPIALEEIEARVDPSGLRGAFWAGLGMSLVGSLLGAALTSYDCNESRGGYYYPCSPREEAMIQAMPLSGFLLGATLGIWIGWESDRTTWQEALSSIRSERSLAVQP